MGQRRLPAGGESDLTLDGGDVRKPTGDSQVSLVPEHGGSDVNLMGGTSDVFGGTDVGLKGGSGELDFEGSGLDMASDLSLGDQERWPRAATMTTT